MRQLGQWGRLERLGYEVALESETEPPVTKAS
jgi:hypothetical protein